MSVSIVIDADDLAEAINRLSGLVTFDSEDLMTAIAGTGLRQTERRIDWEKTAPDGTPWEPNAEGTSILVRTGENLLKSLAWKASDDTAEWGATWENAHVHQDGAVIVPKDAKALTFKLGGQVVAAQKVTIPARPFIGLSADNEAEILELVTDYLGGLL